MPKGFDSLIATTERHTFEVVTSKMPILPATDDYGSADIEAVQTISRRIRAPIRAVIELAVAGNDAVWAAVTELEEAC